MATKKEAQHQKKPRAPGQKKVPGGAKTDMGKMAALMKKKLK